MSSRYLIKKNTKAKKGISPVIATVILVAVAVVIAAALAGFSSTLFGSYSQGSQITVRTIELYAGGSGTFGDGDGDGQMVLVNKGGASETVVSVEVTTYGTSATVELAPLASGLPAVVPANSEATIVFTDIDSNTDGVAPDLEAGQTVTVTVTTQSGQQYTLSTVVKA